MRQEEPSQVENYYPKLIELAEPIKQLIRAFISRKPAIEDLRYLGALEIVSYNLKQINRGYHVGTLPIFMSRTPVTYLI